MKKKRYSLEDYISEKLKSGYRERKSDGYGDFSKAVKNALLKASKSDTGYGTNAEALASAGLGQSGYLGYLNELKSRELKSSFDKISGDKLAKEAKARFINEAETAKAEHNTERMKKTLISYAKREEITDYDTLFEYALYTGLSEEDAKSAVNTAIDEAKSHIRQNAITKTRNAIVTRRFTKTQAYAFAKELGLSEEDATALSNYAYKMNQNTEYIIGERPSYSNGGGGKKPEKIHAKY